MIDRPASARILAVEPDPQSGEVLSRVLDNRIAADVMVVRNVDAALTSIEEQVPDLILTSTFLPPDALAQLIAELRRHPDATHTQVITTPHFLDAPADSASSHTSDRILPFPRARPVVGPFHCDPATLRTQVADYLDQAIALRAAARNTQRPWGPITDLVPVPRSLDPWQPIRRSNSSLTIPTDRDLRGVNVLRPADRRRASRRRAADLAGQWALRLGPHDDASILDISSTGIRLETSTRLHAGHVVDLELIGMDGNHAVSARLIRAETVEVNGSEVKYRAAAMFLHEIDLFTTSANPLLDVAAAESYAPRTLADLLGRVLASASWVSNGTTLRSRFETELRAMVRAKEVCIRAVPVRAAGGCQSLYFNIPSTGDSEYALHIVFERGHRPSAAEFRLLKAAATLAAVVVDLARAGEPPSIN